jgi:hypothetical protein
MTKFVFNSEKIIERDEEGRKISECTMFYLNKGLGHRKWMLLDILGGIREIAGSYKEAIYASDDYKFLVDMHSEATEETEKPRTKAILIEDYSGSSPKLIAFFPYQTISESQMIDAIDTSKSVESFLWRSRMKTGERPHAGKRPLVPQSIRAKVLVRSRGKCEMCGDNLENVTPNIHHKDGNPKNNEMTNLIALCPNCHSNTATYKRPKSSLKK